MQGEEAVHHGPSGLLLKNVIALELPQHQYHTAVLVAQFSLRTDPYPGRHAFRLLTVFQACFEQARAHLSNKVPAGLQILLVEEAKVHCFVAGGGQPSDPHLQGMAELRHAQLQRGHRDGDSHQRLQAAYGGDRPQKNIGIFVGTSQAYRVEGRERGRRRIQASGTEAVREVKGDCCL